MLQVVPALTSLSPSACPPGEVMDAWQRARCADGLLQQRRARAASDVSPARPRRVSRSGRCGWWLRLVFPCVRSSDSVSVDGGRLCRPSLGRRLGMATDRLRSAAVRVEPVAFAGADRGLGVHRLSSGCAVRVEAVAFARADGGVGVHRHPRRMPCGSVPVPSPAQTVVWVVIALASRGTVGVEAAAVACTDRGVDGHRRPHGLPCGSMPLPSPAWRVVRIRMVSPSSHRVDRRFVAGPHLRGGAHGCLPGAGARLADRAAARPAVCRASTHDNAGDGTRCDARVTGRARRHTDRGGR